MGNIVGIVLRVLVTSINSILVLLIVAPEYLEYAGYTLELVGIAAGSVFDVLLWTLLLTGVFNILHVPLSSLVGITILRGAILQISHLAEKPWIFRQKRSTQ